jgi:hypothetical protein
LSVDFLSLTAGYFIPFDRALDADEVAALHDSGGAVPVALRADLVAWYPLNDGIGRHLQDLHPDARHALASATGVTHLLPKKSGVIQRKAYNAASSQLFIEATDILPANAVITAIILDGRRLTVLDTVQQTLTSRRIYITTSTNTLTFSRTAATSAGTALATGDAVSAASCNIAIEYIENP